MNFVRNWPEIQTTIGNYLHLVFLVVCGLLAFRYWWRTKFHLPPGPIGLPLVGYLPFLGKEPFKTLDSLSKKYGNVFSLYLGQTYVVVLGDYSAVKEGFSQSATNYRPPLIFDFIPDGAGLADANGEEWMEQRRLVLRTMKNIGFGRSKWATLVEDEVSSFIKLLSSQSGQPINVAKCLTSSIVDTITSLIIGRSLPEGQDKQLIVSGTDTVIQFFSQSGLWNFFPSLCNLLVKLKITRYYKDYSDMVAFNEIMRKQVEVHNKSQGDSEKFDFISEYLIGMKSKEGKETIFTERNLVGTSRALLVAGTETTKASLLWLFYSMAAYPEIQENVYSELDSFLDKGHRISWEDHLKLPYTCAVIMESLRWRTVIPINVARMTAENINVCGYDIPKGTTILANIWGLHNDSKYWKEPEKFIPERFLQNGDKEIDVKKESFVPFSYGKRKCIGETVAMMQMFLYFTSIMQFFEIRAPGGGKPKMEGQLGLTYQPISQKLCFLPRKGSPRNM